jgi:hypothetical protein
VSRKAPRVRIPPSPPITGGRGHKTGLSYPLFFVSCAALEFRRYVGGDEGYPTTLPTGRIITLSVVGQGSDPGPIHVHDDDVGITVTVRCKHDLLAIG